MRKKQFGNPAPTTRDVNAANRAALALQLRLQKLSYDEIAARAGYSGKGAAQKAVQRELQRIITRNVEQYRAEEMAILDKLHEEAWQLAMDKNNKNRLFAFDRIIELSKERRKLLGLDVARDSNVAAAQIVIREVPTDWISLPEEQHV